MEITPKVMLKLANKFHPPGLQTDVPDDIAKKLMDVGLATASVEPAENAAMPKAKSRKAGGRGGTKSGNKPGSRAGNAK